MNGMQAKEISVKNLANIIQARMGEILDFVTYHLKQVGLDSRALNGGIILTGGGSQLKHLIQLTEYSTGLYARIGFPNGNLAANHIDELKKPMYSTCIGLILKGYSDYEHKYKEFEKTFKKIPVPEQLVKEDQSVKPLEAPVPEKVNTAGRKGMYSFWDKFKNNLLFSFYKQVWTRVGFEKYEKIAVQFKDQVVATKRGSFATRVDSAKAMEALNDLLAKTQQANEEALSVDSNNETELENIPVEQPLAIKETQPPTPAKQQPKTAVINEERDKKKLLIVNRKAVTKAEVKRAIKKTPAKKDNKNNKRQRDVKGPKAVMKKR
jgi:cell division ATPase FtsA